MIEAPYKWRLKPSYNIPIEQLMTVLDKALEVLGQLSAGDRLVGIISHVDKLEESIPQKIRVTWDDKGSHIL